MAVRTVQARPTARWSAGSPSTTASPRADDSGGRPGYLILDVCGAYLRPMGGWVPVARLVALMAELQVDEPATRSAVSRIAKRGLLEPETRDGVRGYRLSPSALDSLEEADRRIFAKADRALSGDGWVLVAFSVPEEERDRRHVLRSKLSWLGFGLLSSGLWIAPARVLPELRAALDRLDVGQYVTFFEGHHRGFGSDRELVERCWDLDGLGETYEDFLDYAGPVRRRWARRTPEGVEAFVDYTLVLNAWRKFPYLDPGLPLELLPPRWAGQRAAEVFFAVRERLAEPAQRYVSEVVTAR